MDSLWMEYGRSALKRQDVPMALIVVAQVLQAALQGGPISPWIFVAATVAFLIWYVALGVRVSEREKKHNLIVRCAKLEDDLLSFRGLFYAELERLQEKAKTDEDGALKTAEQLRRRTALEFNATFHDAITSRIREAATIRGIILPSGAAAEVLMNNWVGDTGDMEGLIGFFESVYRQLLKQATYE